MIRTRLLSLGVCATTVCCLVGAAALAQTPAAKPPDTISVFHSTGPLPSYEVATIKPADPTQPFAGTTLRNYIARAYGVPTSWGMPGVEFEGSQVIGGPGWIDTDKYEIKGKASDEVREAMQSMPSDERLAEDERMEQALLADRFHLKVHFETREMRVFAL